MLMLRLCRKDIPLVSATAGISSRHVRHVFERACFCVEVVGLSSSCVIRLLFYCCCCDVRSTGERGGGGGGGGGVQKREEEEEEERERESLG